MYTSERRSREDMSSERRTYKTEQKVRMNTAIVEKMDDLLTFKRPPINTADINKAGKNTIWLLRLCLRQEYKPEMKNVSEYRTIPYRRRLQIMHKALFSSVYTSFALMSRTPVNLNVNWVFRTNRPPESNQPIQSEESKSCLNPTANALWLNFYPTTLKKWWIIGVSQRQAVKTERISTTAGRDPKTKVKKRKHTPAFLQFWVHFLHSYTSTIPASTLKSPNRNLLRLKYKHTLLRSFTLSEVCAWYFWELKQSRWRDEGRDTRKQQALPSIKRQEWCCREMVKVLQSTAGMTKMGGGGRFNSRDSD